MRKPLFIYKKKLNFSAQALKKIERAGYVPVEVEFMTDAEVKPEPITTDEKWLLDIFLEAIADGGVITTTTIKERVGFRLIKEAHKRSKG